MVYWWAGNEYFSTSWFFFLTTSFKHVFPLHKQHYLTGSPFGKSNDPPDPSVTPLLRVRVFWWKPGFLMPGRVNPSGKICLIILLTLGFGLAFLLHGRWSCKYSITWIQNHCRFLLLRWSCKYNTTLIQNDYRFLMYLETPQKSSILKICPD